MVVTFYCILLAAYKQYYPGRSGVIIFPWQACFLVERHMATSPHADGGRWRAWELSLIRESDVPLDQGGVRHAIRPLGAVWPTDHPCQSSKFDMTLFIGSDTTTQGTKCAQIGRKFREKWEYEGVVFR